MLGSKLNESRKRPPGRPLATKSQIIFAFIAIAWPLFVVSAVESSRGATGTVCPIGWQWGRLLPCLQLIKCAVDAVIITHGAQVLRSATADETDVSKFMGCLSLAAASGISLLFAWFNDSELAMPFQFHQVDIRDFSADGLLVLTAVLGSLSVLTDLHPVTFALAVASSSFVGFEISRLELIPFLSPSSLNEMAKNIYLAVILAVPLWFLAIRFSHAGKPTVSPLLHRSLLITNIGLIGFFWASWMFFSSEYPSRLSLKVGINGLISNASVEAGRWASQAASSKTLAHAVAEYKTRYGISPPPNFDKWYAFAIKHNSPVVDDFGQIQDDLLPFWGEEPAVIRARTAQLFSFAEISVGGLRIRNGAVQLSPHIAGSHRWMTETWQRMIEPVAKWLPDMDLAMNIADECRVGVPFDDMELLRVRARENRSRAQSNQGQAGWSKSELSKTPWPKEFIEPVSRFDDQGAAIDPFFIDDSRRNIFYDWVAASCPPDSKARSSRWWDWSAACVECMMPHSLATSSGLLMANVSLAHELCHQPDIAYLNGFAMSPTVMLGSHTLLPIFSQGRMGGFSDILLPSPWNFNDKSAYNEEAGMAWENKANALFWRGSGSDGYSAHKRWVGFLRDRFVHEAYEKTIAWKSAGVQKHLGVNVSFVGGMTRCDERECAMELKSYELWGTAAMDSDSSRQDVEKQEGRLPPPVPFDEHWRFHHLMDMDGAGFSGRFLSFLESRSLPYRAALFRTWYDERVLAWHHYVPADARLGAGFWAVLEFFGGDADGSSDGAGAETAKRMAEQGRDWARKALRKEDMQIYMFRLLLEWGRIVDDNREHLGFSMPN